MKIFQAKFLVYFLLYTIICFENADGWGSNSSPKKSGDLTQLRNQLLDEMQAFKEEKDNEISEIKTKLEGKIDFDWYQTITHPIGHRAIDFVCILDTNV